MVRKSEEESSLLRKLQISIMYFFSGKMGKMHNKTFPALPKLRKRISKFECGTQLQRRTLFGRPTSTWPQHRRKLGSFIYSHIFRLGPLIYPPTHSVGLALVHHSSQGPVITGHPWSWTSRTRRK